MPPTPTSNYAQWAPHAIKPAHRREERAVHQVLQRLHSVGHSQLQLDVGGPRMRRSSNDPPAYALSFPARA